MVGPTRLVADGLEAQHRADALDHGRLAGPAAPDQDVEVRIEVDSGAVEESSLPGERDELGVLLWLQLAFLGIADARAGVQKGLAQPLDRHL